MDICTAGAISPGLAGFIMGTIAPLTAVAAMAMTAIIALTYAAGNLINNPKLTLWSKTEIVQLFVSIVSVLFLGSVINAFCIIDVDALTGLFEISVAGDEPAESVYEAAETYLVEAAMYSHNALSVARYHLQAYNILSAASIFECGLLRCFFGYSGTATQPFGAYSSAIGALNIFFNSMLVAHVTALNFLFLLLFVYKGFVFLFLPMGVFLRSMPFLRTFGSLFIAVAMSFLIVYPLMLAVLYLMGDSLVDRANEYFPDDFLRDNYARAEKRFPNYGNAGSIWGSIEGAVNPDYFKNDFFPEGERLVDTIIFCAHAFIAAVFMPTAALIATIASIAYVTRLMGEEIDLSRITRMV